MKFSQDVVVLGGGVIGLSIARELRRRGVRRITIVDRGPVGREASWAAAGMLSPNIDAVGRGVFHRFGVESRVMYPSFAGSLLEETGVDVELDRTGTLRLAFDDDEALHLRNTFELQTNAGVAVEHPALDVLREREPELATSLVEGLFYPGDWQVENRQLLFALRQFADDREIRIAEGVDISELLVEGSRVAGARSAKDEFLAETTIIATGAWTSLIKIAGTKLPFEVKPVRGQMISFQPQRPLLRHVVYSRKCYLVPRADGRLLVGATVEDAGFEKGTTAEAVAELKGAAVHIIPEAASLQVADMWSGLRPFAADGLPVIGSLPGYENAIVATAHYRNGILLAPLTAKIVAERILETDESEYFREFGIERFIGSPTNASAVNF